MKIIKLAVPSLFTTLAGLSFITTAAPVEIALSPVQSAKGQIVVKVYQQQKNWMSEDEGESFMTHIHSFTEEQPGDPEMINFDLPEGDYALFLYQDLDMDSEMKTNWIGIPKEPVGTSNDAKGKMGPPDFDDALFNVPSEGTKLKITLSSID
ncbi:DUF2141 domain-containing protein [Thalassotalea mangrovi]|nr:DUF2141 domain-containing protein [Thalassotalea mangrovi]